MEWLKNFAYKNHENNTSKTYTDVVSEKHDNMSKLTVLNTITTEMEWNGTIKKFWHIKIMKIIQVNLTLRWLVKKGMWRKAWNQRVFWLLRE